MEQRDTADLQWWQGNAWDQEAQPWHRVAHRLTYDPHLQLIFSANTVPIKHNERDFICRILDKLDLTNALISLDALGYQRQVTEPIIEVGALYRLQVKGNQPTLLQ